MYHILIVDDDKTNLSAAKNALSDAYKITAVTSGEQALKFLNNNICDLILLDINMPEMDGYEATRRIRALPDKKKAAIPIVAMTANAFEEDQKNALNVGMNGHIAKPLDIQKLFQVLSELLK